MSIYTVVLRWHSYTYFPYEKLLALREVAALLHSDTTHINDEGVSITGRFQLSALKRLVYFSSYEFNDESYRTLQSDLESSCTVTGTQRRQSTRYSVHGLHDYKGKFNPQVVRGILNILEVSSTARILDPFCGSGTSLVECAQIGVKADGFDMNPLAVLIANAKLMALATPEPLLRQSFNRLVKSYEADRPNNHRVKHDARTEYLGKWFPVEILESLECLRSTVHSVADEYKDIFLALASDQIRDYSLQEPSDLRIRRRFSAFPQVGYWNAFKEKTSQFLDNLASSQEIVGTLRITGRAYLSDSRQLLEGGMHISEHKYDAAITSPPYATALPYIDTQRLSLVWLGLISPSEIKVLEANLTGSREFALEQKKQWTEALRTNSGRLQSTIHEYCLKLQSAVSSSDGFRRQSVPSLLYRYVCDMHQVFAGVLNTMKPSAPFALIVGHNQTTLGGKTFDLNTPELLREVATSLGWLHKESISLQAYQRYGIHSANAVKSETLLILQKP